MRRWRDGLRAQEGAAAVEAAIVLPLLLLLVIGIIEIACILFAESVLENATASGARTGATGFAAPGVPREQYIRSEIIRLSSGLLNPGRVNISILAYNLFTDIGKPEPCLVPPVAPCPGRPGVNFVDVNGNGVWDTDMGAAFAGGPGAAVVYRVTYPWTIVSPLLWPFFRGRTHTITAVSMVFNEPAF